VTSIGFVLFENSEQIPSIVSVLSDSYNPHVRYGAAMALGIGCAGTALKEAIVIVESLLADPISFVRQGALIAMSMLLLQQTKVTCPKSVDFREKVVKIINDRREDSMTKFGAILAMGILDAGGRNTTISLQTRTGNSNMTAAVGFLIFQNYWFWYPLTNFISLAFTPTSVIILDKDLQMPNLEIKSKYKPSTFTYPESIQIENDKKQEQVKTAVLSVTAKKQKKVETENTESTNMESMNDNISTDKTEVELDFEILKNPARVIPCQLKGIELLQIDSIEETMTYIPVKRIQHGGIIVVRNSQHNKR